MSQNSKIEWTEQTWNPVTGCTKISPGCKHCYAEVMAARLKAMGQANYRNGFEVTLQPHMLTVPIRRRKPTMYFVNSMSDLFHEGVPFEYVAAVFGVMAATPRHTYQVLTKRPLRMREFFDWAELHGNGYLNEHGFHPALHACAWEACSGDGWGDVEPPEDWVIPTPDVFGRTWPLPNVWLGVSVEDREYGLPRIDELRVTPAAIRFLSIEPLLEDIGQLDLIGIDWVIVGGESGAGARPMHPEWARAIRDQCVAAGVPFLFKQWGAWVPRDHTQHEPQGDNWGILELDGTFIHTATPWTVEPNGGVAIRRVGKNKSGRVLDGRTWDEMPRRNA